MLAEYFSRIHFREFSAGRDHNRTVTGDDAPTVQDVTPGKAFRGKTTTTTSSSTTTNGLPSSTERT